MGWVRGGLRGVGAEPPPPGIAKTGVGGNVSRARPRTRPGPRQEQVDAVTPPRSTAPEEASGSAWWEMDAPVGNGRVS
eukprot:8536425-Alexandrium_andersonii.AAC.1